MPFLSSIDRLHIGLFLSRTQRAIDAFTNPSPTKCLSDSSFPIRSQSDLWRTSSRNSVALNCSFLATSKTGSANFLTILCSVKKTSGSIWDHICVRWLPCSLPWFISTISSVNFTMTSPYTSLGTHSSSSALDTALWRLMATDEVELNDFPEPVIATDLRDYLCSCLFRQK